MKKMSVVIAMSALVYAFGWQTSLARSYQMGIAHLGKGGSALDLGAQKWGELVTQRSNGKIRVKYYPASQLGKEADIVTSMQMGSVEGSIIGTTLYKQAAPEYNIWSAYYLFESSDQALALQNTKVGEECRAAVLKNKGVRIVGYGMRGPRHVTCNKPVRVPSDMKSLKIRIPLQPIYVASWKKLGAIPTPLAFGEVYTSLKMGIVDCQENPLELIENAHFDEVQKYVNLTGHQNSFFTYSVSETWFQRLPKNLQKIVIQAGKEAGQHHTKTQKAKEESLKGILTKRGMTFIEANQSAFHSELKSIPDQFKSEWVPGLYGRIQEELKRLK